MKRKKQSKLRNVLIGATVAGLVTAAVSQQLRLPAEERTWHGDIAGIPYDFRLPTVERLKNTFWNKDTDQVFVPHAFGIGWSINMYPLVHPKERVLLK